MCRNPWRGTTAGQHSEFSIITAMHLVMNLVAVAVFTVRGQGGVMFRAKRDALMGSTLMWKKRRQVQSKRVVSWRAILRVLEKGFG